MFSRLHRCPRQRRYLSLEGLVIVTKVVISDKVVVVIINVVVFIDFVVFIIEIVVAIIDILVISIHIFIINVDVAVIIIFETTIYVKSLRTFHLLTKY